jgi:site-specific recombinase XerD
VNRETLSKNRWGSVNPFTRHLSDCEHAIDANHNSCACPKWLYVNPRGAKPRRYALNTPSWAEAKEIATDTLKAFDPEIAEARAAKRKEKRTSRTVLEAIDLWLQRARNGSGADSTIVKQYRSTFGWIDKDGLSHGSLLRFVEDWNVEYPKERIDTIDDMSTLICQEWLSSESFRSLSSVTRNQRWGTVRSFFSFLSELQVIARNPVAMIKAPPANDIYANAPYTPEQYERILEQADWYVDERVRNGEREVYCTRLHTFIETLRHTGMDIVDAVKLRPADQIKDESVDGELVAVLRYTRSKTGIEGVIPLEAGMAEMIRSTPSGNKTVPGMPFRYLGNDVRSDVHNWSRRISALFELAGVTAIPLMGKDGKPALDDFGRPLTKHPNVKMLRHTFAVACLLAGMRAEAVAKMLGHASVEMLRRHYGPWCKQRDEAHVREVAAILRPQVREQASQKTKAVRHRFAGQLQ